MSEFIGARISLISKSDIRYSGTLHNISSEDSTVSLENVSSFGTEDRRTGDDFIAPSEQVYEYIVFRGSDVKDLRIEDAPVPKAMPPAMPNDPAIVGARPRPVNNASQFQQGPPQGIPPQGGPGFHPNMPIPPGPGGWGPNGPGPRNFPYPPPAGWYPPQGPGFGPGGPAGSGGPGGPQWNNNFYPPGPPFAPGPPGPGRPQQGGPGPMGGPEVSPGQPGGPSELEPKSLGQPPLAAPNKPAAASGASAASAAPAAAGPSADRPAAPPASASAAASAPAPAPVPAATRPPAPSARTTDAPAPATAGGEDASLMAATAAAKAAVANAMSKVNSTSQQAPATRGGPAAPVDNLTQKFNEMRVNATRDPNQPPHHHNHHNNNSNHYGSRGRGRGGSYGNGPRRTHNPVPVPNTAFDFEASNQKFNKEDVVKEVIASGDVDAVMPAGPSGAESESALGGPGGEADTAEAPVAYSKTRSFFDNISSEAKDRAANAGQKPGSREWRGEEQRKNMETFGQGSVDGNHRGYRGRGRGRGRGYGRGRGNGGYRQNNYNKAD